MKTFEEIQEVVERCSYRDWEFEVTRKGDGFLLQCSFIAWCPQSKANAWQFGRKWYLSPHICTSEIVQTVLMAILAAEEHEARENFRYLGAKVFHPHQDMDVLAHNARSLDVREGDAK